MKILISHDEISNIIRSKFSLPDDCQVIISRKPVEPAEKANVKAFKKALDKTFKECPRYQTDQKISAIKNLRIIGAEFNLSIGLAEAKFAVENPQQAIANMVARDVIY